MNGTQALTAETPRSAALVAAGAAGAIAAAASTAASPAEGFAGILVGSVFGITACLGALVLLATSAASGARWWKPIREVPLLVARTLPIPVLFLALALTLGMKALYPWARPEVVAGSHLLGMKAAWLNPSFFLARATIVVVIWLAFIAAFRERVAAWAQGGAAPDRRLVATSSIFLIVLGATLSVASWDWVMSLSPEWFSTMWAVYVFAGAFQGGIAAVALATLHLERVGGLAPSPAIRHDLGKLLFAFSCFWAYIWFCQYMLIWYANIPEETAWFAGRVGGGYAMLFWLDAILSFVVPFVVLMPARAKTNPAVLRQVAVAVLAGRWIDTFLMVAPSLGPARGFPIAAIGATVAVGAGMLLLAGHHARAERLA